MKITNNTIGKKIAWGFVLLGLILSGVVGGTFFEMKEVQSRFNRVTNLRVVTAETTLKMLNGVNQSLAALRGWIILKQNQFKENRRNAWDQEIRPSFNVLRDLSRKWTDSQNVKYLQLIEGKLDAFQKIQTEIEFNASTLQNTPAQKILVETVVPASEQYLAQITSLIDQELIIDEGESRKMFLGILADLRGSMASAISNIRGFLITQDPKFKIQFEQEWNKNSRRFKDLLSQQDLMTQQQRLAFEKIVEAREIIQPLPEKMFEILESPNWNKAQYLLSTKAIPLSKEIISLLKSMAESQVLLRNKDLQETQKGLNATLNFGFLFLFFGLLACAFLGFRITRSVSLPIQEAIKVSDRIAEGHLDESFKISGSEEVEHLGQTLETMRQNLLWERNRLQDEKWVQTQYGILIDKLQGWKNLEDFSSIFIEELCPLLKTPLGLIYLNGAELGDRDPDLVLKGTYCYVTHESSPSRFEIGEGLVGQCAVNQKQMSLKEIPEGYINIRSGTGESPPRYLDLWPICIEDRLLAVIELASFQEFNPLQRILLERLSNSVGIILNNIAQGLKTEKLLEESQALTEEYHSQSQELQIAYEKLTEKTQSLNEQKVALEKRGQEISSAKKDLEIKAHELTMASKYKSEFLANMSHELRTPLNSLLVLSKLLAENKENNLSVKEMEFAQTIFDSGNDLLRLLNDVLDLSKIEAGKIDILCSGFDLTEIRNHIQRNFKEVARQKNLDLRVILPENESIQLFTDIKRLQQILTNLLSNAFKFTESGYVEVEFYFPDSERLIYLGSPKRKEPFVAFSVRDTGIGISKEKQGSIMEAFQQVDGSTSRKYGGTGLGLSICREMSRLLGGEVYLSSQPGKGTEVTLLIPVNHPDADTNVSTPVSEVVSKQVPDLKTAQANQDNSGGRKWESPIGTRPIRQPYSQTIHEPSLTPHVLIVEDDVAFANVLLEMVERYGLAGILATEGESALSLAREYCPDVIILDIKIPLLNGWALLDLIKHDPELKHIPVHVVSVVEDPKRALDQGASSYLEKPVGKDDLESMFNEMIDIANQSQIRVLILESDHLKLESINSFLADSKTIVAESSPQEQVLDHLQTGSFDCLVLDWSTDWQLQIEFLKEIRSQSTKELTVITHTETEIPGDKEAELEKLSDSIIIKGDKSEERLIEELVEIQKTKRKNLFRSKQEDVTPDVFENKDDILYGKTVLIVDDDVRNIFALTSALENEGLNVIYAENGEDSMETLVDVVKVDIILMDIMMPGIDGYETMRKIRKMENFKELPILALTAKAMKEDRQKCLDAGASDYITKPVEMDRLLSLMRIWLYC